MDTRNMIKLLTCRHPMMTSQFLNGTRYFRPIYIPFLPDFPKGTMFVRLSEENPNQNGGWNLVVMSPAGEIAMASSYHFFEMNE